MNVYRNLQKTRLSNAVARCVVPVREWLTLDRVRQGVFPAALLLSLLAAVYWLLIASDRYVSVAHVIIQRTDMSGGQTVDFSGLLGNVGGVASDQLLLRDHLLSTDMLLALDAKLGLREHYSDWHRDPLSRMWSADEPLEAFHEYWLKRVSVEFDEYAGVLVIRAQAYDPDTAYAIVTMLVAEGERHMNAIAHELARGQVEFLERQGEQMNERAIAARQAVITFQNEKGLASPLGAAEALEAIIGKLEAQLTDLQTRRNAMLGYLMPKSPDVVEVDLQIAATRQQIEREQSRIAAPDGDTLNRAVEEFQRLEMQAHFTQDVYKTALVALEKGRIEATRALKKVSVLQSPTRPQYPLQPQRIYNSIVFLLLSLVLAGVIKLIVVIIRDHRD